MAKNKCIIKNPQLLIENTDISHRKDLLVIREYQLQELEELKTDASVKYIQGSPGTGKTTLVNAFKNSLDPLDNIIVYVECRIHDSSKKIYRYVRNELLRYYPEFKNVEDDLDAIDQILKANHSKKIWIVLDELEIPITTKGVRSDFVHNFCRWATSDEKMLTKFIFVTNLAEPQKYFGDHIMQILRHNKILFGAYNATELLEILKRRSKEALHENTYTIESLAFIARECIHQFDSNARDLIRLLYVVAKRSENNLDFEIVEEVTNEILQEEAVQYIEQLSKVPRIFLKSIMEVAIRNGSKTFTSKDVLPIFNKLCKQEKIRRMFTLNHLGHYTRSMVSAGIITKTDNTYNKHIEYRILIDFNKIQEKLVI